MKRLNILLLFIFIISFSACSNKKSEVSAVPSNQNNDVMNEIKPTEQRVPTKQSETKPSIPQYYIFPNSSKQLLTQADLFLYDLFTLKLAKNEIFAKKGTYLKINLYRIISIICHGINQMKI